jgi:transcriptional regulator with XRE-family HTH domain
MPGAQGSIDRRRLGIALREMRTGKGITPAQVAEHTGWSESKVSRQERGLSPISPADLRVLLRYYEVTDQASIDFLLGLASGSRGRDWWHQFSDVTPRQFSTYLGFEAVAASIHTYELAVVPGLLQTQEYARALVDAVGDAGTEKEAERRVEARAYRQQILTGEHAPRLHAIVGEAVLHIQVGGAQVMRGQLAHMADLARRPNVTVQVVPFAAGAHRAMEQGFIVLRFADTEMSDVVSVDLRTRSLYVDNPNEVAAYRDAWESVLSVAATPTDSLQMITAAADKEKS